MVASVLLHCNSFRDAGAISMFKRNEYIKGSICVLGTLLRATHPIIGGIIYHLPDTYELPLPLVFSSHIRLAVARTYIAELAFLFQSGSNTVGIGRGKVEVIAQVGNRDERLSGE